MRVLDKWNIEKKPVSSQPTNEPVEAAGIFVTYFIIRAYHDVIK